jgi:hypothetical protein
MTTAEARMPDAASLPPRSALLRDVDIPALPGVGITWYDRGGKYWRRRVALALMRAVALLLIVLIDVGIFTAIHKSSPGAFAVVFLFCPALILAMFLMSLMPEPLAERQARLWMAERLRERGYCTTAG